MKNQFIKPLALCIIVLFFALWGCKDDKPIPDPEFDPDTVPYIEKMVLAISVTGDETAVRLPLSGVDCYINWGSGTWERVSGSYPVHTYTEEGKYLVTIAGTVAALNSSGLSSSERSCIIGVHNWGKTGLVSMHGAFEGCTELTYLPNDDEGSFADVISFGNAFAGCSSLTEIPTFLFDNCTKVTSLSGAFSGCSNLTEIPARLFKNSPQVNNFEAIFQNCKSLTAIPAELFDNCKNGYNFLAAFQNCESLREIPTGLFDNCKKIDNVMLTFAGCKNLTGESPYTTIDGSKVHLYDRDENIGGFAKPNYTYFCFNECTGLSDFANIPDGWK